MVGRSVSWSVTLSSKTREIDIFVQIVKRNHVIMSSCNNSISKRTHRWPYGPCLKIILRLFSFDRPTDLTHSPVCPIMASGPLCLMSSPPSHQRVRLLPIRPNSIRRSKRSHLLTATLHHILPPYHRLPLCLRTLYPIISDRSLPLPLAVHLGG